MLYAVADRVVDDYAEVIEGLEDDIEEVETEVFSRAPEQPGQRIYKLKREVLELRRAVKPLTGPMQRLTDRQTGLPMDPRTGDYFRDVHDHLMRDSTASRAFDEMLAGALQANLRSCPCATTRTCGGSRHGSRSSPSRPWSSGCTA